MPGRIKVVCVGPATDVRGGISRVIGKIKDRFPPHVEFVTVATYPQQKRYGAPDWRYRCRQCALFGAAFLRIALLAAFSRRTIFHVHLSERGSAIRKGLVCVMLRLFGATFLVHTHAAENAMFHTWVPRGVRRLLLWGFTGARRIVVLTQFWRAYYARIFTKPLDRFILLPNPSDLPASTPDRTGRKQLNLLFLGRIGERKGAFDLIEAFASLPEGLAGALRLTLAGDGDVDQARALAARTGCAARTSVLGWVSATQVVELLESADALLLPSRGEGMSIALLEALGAGLPVVTTRAGGTEDFIEHGRNGLLLEPGNLPAIRAAMCQLATDPALRERLGREARHTALGFSIERYVATLTSVYEQIASGGDGAVPAHFLGWSQPPSPGSGNPAA